jgi:rubrerythrin
MKISNNGKDLVITDFNEIEALRLAMKLEQDGIKYYSELATKSKDPLVKKAFGLLAKEEQEHFDKFKAWLDELGVEADAGSEEGEFDFIDTGVFGDIWKTEDHLKKIKTDLDAISLGEWAELNSIKFYKAMYDKTVNDPGRKTLNDIIKQEQGHLKAFVRYKELLEKNKAC